MLTIEQLQDEVKKRHTQSKKIKESYDFSGTQMKYLEYKTEERVYAELLYLIENGV